MEGTGESKSKGGYIWKGKAANRWKVGNKEVKERGI